MSVASVASRRSSEAQGVRGAQPPVKRVRTMAPSGRGRERVRPKRNSRGVIAAVRPIAERLAAVHGLVLWEVAFAREAGRETLRVACDRVGGISSGELAALSEHLSRELDHVDVVPGNARYVLEVTSPGAERKLHGTEQFAVCVGRDARVTLKDGRSVDGKIDDVTDDLVQLQTEEGAVRVFLDDIRNARLVIRGIG